MADLVNFKTIALRTPEGRILLGAQWGTSEAGWGVKGEGATKEEAAVAFFDALTGYIKNPQFDVPPNLSEAETRAKVEDLVGHPVTLCST